MFFAVNGLNQVNYMSKLSPSLEKRECLILYVDTGVAHESIQRQAGELYTNPISTVTVAALIDVKSVQHGAGHNKLLLNTLDGYYFENA